MQCFIPSSGQNFPGKTSRMCYSEEMKIEGPNRTQQSGATQKKSGVSGRGSAFGDLLAGEAAGPSSLGATHSIAHIDALLAAQEAESPTERAARKRMVQRADSLLDELEQIRLGLLTGTLTIGHLIDIADVVAVHREKVMDPRMTAILDEIDLRAQIELAKMRKALEQRSL